MYYCTTAAPSCRLKVLIARGKVKYRTFVLNRAVWKSSVVFHTCWHAAVTCGYVVNVNTFIYMLSSSDWALIHSNTSVTWDSSVGKQTQWMRNWLCFLMFFTLFMRAQWASLTQWRCCWCSSTTPHVFDLYSEQRVVGHRTLHCPLYWILKGCCCRNVVLN